jgi:hypothetical protein
MRKIYLEILTDVEVLSPSEYEIVIFGIPSLYACMDVISLPLERLGGFYSYSVYKNLKPRNRK